MTNDALKQCCLCKSTSSITFHHLIPKACHKNKWFKKNFSRDEMLHSGVDMCQNCNDFIHHVYSEKELGRNFNTLEKLQSCERIKKHVDWARKQQAE